VIVGTPGKVYNLFSQKYHKFHVNPTTIFFMVLDEADKMLNSEELFAETQKVRSLCKNVKQFLLTSATFPDQILENAKTFVRIPKLQPEPCWSLVRVVPKDGRGYVIPKLIQHYILRVKPEANRDIEDVKIDVLAQIFKLLESPCSFVFANRKMTCIKICDRIEKEKIRCVSLTSTITPDERKKVFRSFIARESRICIATNIGSRGLDIPHCTTVVNFDIPEKQIKRQKNDPKFGQNELDAVTYVHRAGRTGRYGRAGISITLVTSPKEVDDILSIFQQCIRTDNQPIQYCRFDCTPEGMDEMMEGIAATMAKKNPQK
jgi:ATP-dependent RNA helicase DDX19/DBP5